MADCDDEKIITAQASAAPPTAEVAETAAPLRLAEDPVAITAPSTDDSVSAPVIGQRRDDDGPAMESERSLLSNGYPSGGGAHRRIPAAAVPPLNLDLVFPEGIPEAPASLTDLLPPLPPGIADDDGGGSSEGDEP